MAAMAAAIAATAKKVEHMAIIEIIYVAAGAAANNNNNMHSINCNLPSLSSWKVYAMEIIHILTLCMAAHNLMQFTFEK